MELYQLKTFATVAEEGHLTRAAERLHISQPAVSAQIKALEEQLDVRLFERSSTGMVLTSVGAELVEYAQQTLAAAEKLKQAARAMKGEISGRLRVGTSSDPESIRLGELLGRAVERFPRLELELHHEMSGAALEHVRGGRLDASFYFGKLSSPGVTGMPLGELVYRVAAPGGWSARVRDADWNDIVAMPWVMTPTISTHRQLVQELFEEHGGQPLEHHVQADNESVIGNLVAAGVGVSLMAENAALEKQRAGEVCIWDKARLRTTLWFIYREERAHDPLIGALLEVLREIWQRTGDSSVSVEPRQRKRHGTAT